ncbi:hypothetical protein [Pseudovibrio sp. POLY-S9]|uniref:hypothetical protein n=1 Tax=Pseudovibrio sp. POLY-S9 TaxID=1576596 RepID=UPI00191066C6|nr:hypothetical protein [Pseudovibrio sp. POLY-S9]
MIVNTLNSQRVIRYAMGNAGKYSIKKSAIGLDYDAVDALGVRFKEICQLQARKATQWEVLVWFWNHKDLPTQLSIRLGVLGLMLGLIGFLSSLLPMLLS